jgi:hypothetical protein
VENLKASPQFCSYLLFFTGWALQTNTFVYGSEAAFTLLWLYWGWGFFSDWPMPHKESPLVLLGVIYYMAWCGVVIFLAAKAHKSAERYACAHF